MGLFSFALLTVFLECSHTWLLRGEEEEEEDEKKLSGGFWLYWVVEFLGRGRGLVEDIENFLEVGKQRVREQGRATQGHRLLSTFCCLQFFFPLNRRRVCWSFLTRWVANCKTGSREKLTLAARDAYILWYYLLNATPSWHRTCRDLFKLSWAGLTKYEASNSCPDAEALAQVVKEGFKSSSSRTYLGWDERQKGSSSGVWAPKLGTKTAYISLQDLLQNPGQNKMTFYRI